MPAASSLPSAGLLLKPLDSWLREFSRSLAVRVVAECLGLTFSRSVRLGFFAVQTHSRNSSWSGAPFQLLALQPGFGFTFKENSGKQLDL